MAHSFLLLLSCVVAILGHQKVSGLSQSRPSIAEIRASRTSVQNVNDVKECLTEYMQLPPSQYSCVPMPMNSALDRVYGTADQFRLRVPPMQLKSPGVPAVEVRPLMMAKVNVEENRVVITSDSCQIRGSKIIEDLNINDFFEFQVKICLTWESTSGGSAASCITAESDIQVDLDPPGLFSLVPRKILAAVGTRAIGVTLGLLQKNFLVSLGSDFERWSVDEDYRLQRKQLELDMASETPMEDELGETLMAYLK